MLDIIFFAILAGFILTRLFKILGDTSHDNDANTGRQEDTFMQELHDAYAEDMQTKKDLVQQIDIASGLEAELSERDREVFEELRSYDPQLTADAFVHGAKNAFEMILVAFAEGNKDTLRQLLIPEVYKNFAKEIDRRNRAKEKHETTVVSIQGCEIIGTAIEEGMATITVEIASEQINVVTTPKTKEDEQPPAVVSSTDTWSFTKRVASRNNIWQLSATD